MEKQKSSKNTPNQQTREKIVNALEISMRNFWDFGPYR